MKQKYISIAIIMLAVISLCKCSSIVYRAIGRHKDRQYRKELEIKCDKTVKELGEMVDTTVMDYGDYEVMLMPCTYCPGDFVRYIFAVPRDNMVGTNEIENSLSLLEFKSDEELERDVVKRNFLDMVTGPFKFRFLPVWSEDEIAYSQTRGFIIADISRRDVDIHTVIPGLDDVIGDVKVLDGKNRTFVFEVLKPNGNRQGDIWDDKILRVIRFKNTYFDILAQHPAGIKSSTMDEPWFIYDKMIFIYNDNTTSLKVYDEKFNEAGHPLAKAFNNNNDKFRQLYQISIHPDFKFALIVETGKNPDWDYLESLPSDVYEKVSPPILEESRRRTLYLFRWTHPDPEKRFVPLLSKAGSIWNSYNPDSNYDNFSFSPDGKWVVFRDYTGNHNNPVFVAVPIDEKNPLYLGKPVKLGNVLRAGNTGPRSTAWTTNPTAFTMADGMVIYRWNLDKYDTVEKVKMPPGAKDPFVNGGN